MAYDTRMEDRRWKKIRHDHGVKKRLVVTEKCTLNFVNISYIFLPCITAHP